MSNPLQTAQNRLNRAKEAEQPQDVLNQAVQAYDYAGNRIFEMQQVQAQAKQLLEDLLEEMGVTTMQTSTGTKVTQVQPTTTTSWNSKKLNELMEDDDLAEILAPARKTTVKKGYVRIS